MDIVLKKVNEFIVGERVDAFLIIKKVELKTTNSNNKKYLDFILGDKTGEIVGKMWEVPQDLEQSFSVNMIVKARGTITSFNNSQQFKVEKIRPVVQEDNVSMEELIVSAPLEAEFMIEEIRKFIDSMKNEDIKNIVNLLFNKNLDRLRYYPAAKRNHHSVRSGLLYHVLTMLRNGKNISMVYDFLDTDLVYAGVILHDMSKLDEMDSSELGIVSEYTTEGMLLGHISQGVKAISEAAKEVNADPEIEFILEHMVLSHHYEPEYGSPVRPMFPEAELLHYLDIIDARMFDMKNITEKLDKGTFSDPIMTLDRRRIYRPKYK